MRAPEFWSRNEVAARLLSRALAPIGWLYGASVAFKRDHTRPWRAAPKVICVGNLTAGGSGKTPVAIAVARNLLAKGLRVAFLTRGYGGDSVRPVVVDLRAHDAKSVGDEPLLLAAVAPTIVASDRKAGAMLVDKQGIDVIVMDDGHQNFSLEKDLSIVVVDAESGFGNRRILPAGPLRESVSQGLARADAVVLVGDGMAGIAHFDGPILRAHLVPDRDELRGSRVAAFAGIGRPQKFFDMLERTGAKLTAQHAFPDHHSYSESEILALRTEAESAGATLVTTEKDFIRLRTEQRTGIRAIPIHAEFESVSTLQHVLDAVIHAHEPRTISSSHAVR